MTASSVLKKSISYLMLVILCTTMLFGCGEEPVNTGENIEQAEETTLSGRMVYYPDNVFLYENFSELEFSDGNMNKFRIADILDNEINVLFYWGSWCEYCDQELIHAGEFKDLIEDRGDTSIFLIDKLDPEKESVDQAEEYLRINKIEFRNIFDDNMEVYDSLGMKRIPTTFFVDREGKLLYSYVGIIDSSSMLESMLDIAKYGYAYKSRVFVETNMLKNGGMITSMDKSLDHPAYVDVLSESQGLLMQYAVIKDDISLFNQLFDFVSENMEENGAIRWYYDSDGDKQPKVNATLDDLRIYNALDQAVEKWGNIDTTENSTQMKNLRLGDYAKMRDKMRDTLCAKAFCKDGLVNFYSLEGQQDCQECSLCYLDLEVLKTLDIQEYEKCKAILEKGYISDEFPFYYSAYDYKKAKYSDASINMAEGMYTLLNLSKSGMLKETSKRWIMDKLKGDGIMAGYGIDGNLTPGKGYESTGIYAITAMIGMYENDSEMVSYSINRMNDFMIKDSSSIYDGGFGNIDGSGFYSFDQCMSLLAFAMMESANIR